jgi:hypothetical protein
LILSCFCFFFLELSWDDINLHGKLPIHWNEARNPSFAFSCDDLKSTTNFF